MFSYNVQNALVLERKDDMKKRGIPSPDVADAFALTFAYPVMGGQDEEEEPADDTAWNGRSRTTGY